MKSLDSGAKLKILGEEARYDVCGYPAIFSQKDDNIHTRHSFIYTATGEMGNCVKLFKVLLSNECRHNCFYCANSRDRNFCRVTFTPDELAQIFIEYYKKRHVHGLFLSSAIPKDSESSQQEMTETIKILRLKYKYNGYIHYKILPQASKSSIEEASKFADRLSINLEVPNQEYLQKLSPDKNFEAGLLNVLKEISAIDSVRPLKAGITTQLVVGAAEESDREILFFAGQLYSGYKLWRVYYSGFVPVKGTPLEGKSPCSPMREMRLYQADFLLRKYQFSPSELSFDEKGNLDISIDPKLAWAKKHPERFPLEINKASFWQLIRIPGIGQISAGRIIQLRRSMKIKDTRQLRKLGVLTKRAQTFITLDGKSFSSNEAELQKTDIDRQLFLWEEI